MRISRIKAAVVVVIAMGFALVAEAAAQDLPMTTVSSINAGLMHHRLDGRGTNPFFAFRTYYVVSELSVAEAAIGYGQPAQDFGRSHFVVMEGQYQVRWPLDRFAPYAGMGAGLIVDSPTGGGQVVPEEGVDPSSTSWAPTFALGAGARAWLDERTRVMTDIRWRGIGADFRDSSFELTFGLGWRW